MGLESVSTADLPLAFGQLQLIELLSDGPLGRVFLADSPTAGGLPERVCVRVVRPPHRRGAQPPMNTLLADLQRARSLRHAAICQTFACGVEDGSIFVISERPEGPSLAELVAGSGALPLQSAVAIIAQVSLALEHAHSLVHSGRSNPLLHRHLSPHWIHVAPTGRVKVAGFGLADLVDPYSAASATPASALAFACPEVLAGQRLSARSDVFSLGALLAYASLGEPPFAVAEGAQKAQYLSSIVRALAAGALAARMDELAPGLGELIQGMVALDPMGRPEHVHLVVDGLRSLLDASDNTEEELELESTLGLGGPPSVRAADVAHIESMTRGQDSEITDPGAQALTDSGTQAPTDPGAQPLTDPGARAPTDRMSTLFYRQHGGGGTPVVAPRPPASLSPVVPAPVAWGDDQQETPVPRRRVRQKGASRGSGSTLVPVLAVVIFFVFVVFAGVVALVVMKMASDGASTTPSEQQEAVVPAQIEAEPTQAKTAVEISAAEDPDAASGEAGADETEIEIVPEPSAEREEALTPSPRAQRAAPVRDTGGADDLAISHRPKSKGDAGVSDLISVRVVGPADTVVEVFSGPAGGPFVKTALKRRGSGRWEGWLGFDVPSGGVLEYWVVASHPQGVPAYSGSEQSPHRVEVR